MGIKYYCIQIISDIIFRYRVRQGGDTIHTHFHPVSTLKLFFFLIRQDLSNCTSEYKDTQAMISEFGCSLLVFEIKCVCLLSVACVMQQKISEYIFL